MNSQPLPPRRTDGVTRYRRRLEQSDDEESSTGSQNSRNDGHEKLSSQPAVAISTTSVAMVTQRRRPKVEIEDQIDAAIARRKQQIHGGGSANVDDARQIQNVTDTIVGQYEYLDHTADVQLHAWGKSLTEAMENTALAMFGYMTDLRSVRENESMELPTVYGHDVQSVVFCFLQEWLSTFHETGFIPRLVHIDGLEVEASSHETDGQERWIVRSSGRGESYDPNLHVPGTEVKAITYSNLQVIQSAQNEDSSENGDQERFDIWVIVDI